MTLAEESDRHASWLELFFDLVFVVAITELSGQLVADHSAGGFLRFAALFISGRRGPVGSLARVRHALAVLGLEVLELSLPPLSTRLHRRIPTSPRHLPERWALFTLIVLGESVAAVAISTSDTNWHVTSVAAAALGFAAVAAVWWLYFDRQASVVLRGSTMSIVVYSYAHIPLLMGLAAMGAGLRLVIERAGEDHLGTGASVALLGGAVVFLLALIGTRVVTVQGRHGIGVAMKLVAGALIAGVVAAESTLPPVAVAGALAFVLAAAVFAERTLIQPGSTP